MLYHTSHALISLVNHKHILLIRFHQFCQRSELVLGAYSMLPLQVVSCNLPIGDVDTIGLRGLPLLLALRCALRVWFCSRQESVSWHLVLCALAKAAFCFTRNLSSLEDHTPARGSYACMNSNWFCSYLKIHFPIVKPLKEYNTMLYLLELWYNRAFSMECTLERRLGLISRILWFSNPYPSRKFDCLPCREENKM